MRIFAIALFAKFARLDVGLRNNVYPNRQGRIANQQSVSKLSPKGILPRQMGRMQWILEWSIYN
jgi:hypothetical protein